MVPCEWNPLIALTQFNQNSGGGLGVQKSDLGATGPDSGLLVD
jgi:hypothetical protein